MVLHCLFQVVVNVLSKRIDSTIICVFIVREIFEAFIIGIQSIKDLFGIKRASLWNVVINDALCNLSSCCTMSVVCIVECGGAFLLLFTIVSFSFGRSCLLSFPSPFSFGLGGFRLTQSSYMQGIVVLIRVKGYLQTHI